MRQVLTYALAGLMVLTVLAVPIAVVVAFLWVGVFTNPIVLKLLGVMAVLLLIGLAWAAATGDKKDAPDS